MIPRSSRLQPATFPLMLAALLASGCSTDATGPNGGGNGGGAPPEPTQTLLDTPDYAFQQSYVGVGVKPEVVVRQDQPVVAFMLEAVGDAGFIRAAWGGAGGLGEPETIQNGYLYGPLDIEVSPSGTVAVSYHDHDRQDAVVAVSDGGGWTESPIDDPGHDGWDSSIAFTPDGDVHVLSIDPSQFGATQSVEHAWTDAAGLSATADWQVQSLGAGPVPYEWGTDLAADGQGRLHGVYFDASQRDLVYVTWDGSEWTRETLFEEGDAGRFAAIAVDAADRPRVAFFQADGAGTDNGPSPGRILYGTRETGGWEFQEVGRVEDHLLGPVDARRTVALALAGDAAYVAFIDVASLQVSRVDTGGVATHTVAEAGTDPLQVVSLDVDGAGGLHIAYSTITGRAPLTGHVWYLRGTPRS